jgi:hypothetical protein
VVKQQKKRKHLILEQNHGSDPSGSCKHTHTYKKGKQYLTVRSYHDIDFYLNEASTYMMPQPTCWHKIFIAKDFFYQVVHLLE